MQHCQDFRELRSEVHTLDERVVKGETEVSALELRIAHLEKRQEEFQDKLAEVQLQAKDQENRSRHNNLRIR